MNNKRQPIAARVWGSLYRTWWPADSARHRKKAKRRSARRERQAAKCGGGTSVESIIHWLEKREKSR